MWRVVAVAPLPAPSPLTPPTPHTHAHAQRRLSSQAPAAGDHAVPAALSPKSSLDPMLFDVTHRLRSGLSAANSLQGGGGDEQMQAAVLSALALMQAEGGTPLQSPGTASDGQLPTPADDATPPNKQRVKMVKPLA